MNKKIRIVLVILLVGVLLFSLWKITEILQDYWAGEEFYAQMEQFVSVPTPIETMPEETDSPEEPSQAPPEEDPLAKLPWPVVDFEALRAVNPDVVGWIYIPDTQVNYPILQGRNNDQYIRRLMTGEYNSAGSIFLDSNNFSDFSEKNSVIYGHNMKNGTMFAGITGYKSQEFFDAHPYGMLLTPEAKYCVRFFSGYVADVREDAWQISFTEEAYSQWLDELGRKSYFTAQMSPSAADRVLTFSTCTYETKNARFVVHGILEEYKENTAD